MVVQYNDILKIVTTLGDDENLQITVKQSAKGGLIAGISCALGGLLGGPPGLAVGGTAGGLLAAYLAGNSFKPVSTVILYEMRPVDQRALVEAVKSIIQHLDAMDAVEVLAILQGNAILKTKIISEMTTFFQQQLELQVMSK